MDDLIAELSVHRANIVSADKAFWSQVEGAVEYNETPKIQICMMGRCGVTITLKNHTEYGNGGILNLPSCIIPS